MEYLELISVPAIATIVYWVINLIKYAVKDNEKFKRFIPLISAALGAILGLVAYYAVPSIIPAANVCVAILIGGASGLTATGTNQIIKQLGKRAMTERAKMEKTNETVQYQMSKAILDMLLKNRLITVKEYAEIDKKNRATFA